VIRHTYKMMDRFFLCLSLYPRPVQSILLNLSRDMGRSQPSRISFLILVSRWSFFQTALRSCGFCVSCLFLSKLLHELRRFQTAETGHCCVYNIDVSFGCIVTSCGWGGGGGPFWNDILQNEWQAKVQKEERGALLSRTCFYISHEMQQ
jgi:hypothetical protein